MNFWQQDKWNGFFPVKWHIIKDVPNPQFRHIILENNENKPVTNSRDTQEVCLIAFQYLTRDSWYFFYRLESFVSYFFVSWGHAKKFMSISCYCPCGCCWNNLASFFCFMRNVKKFMCIGFHATAHVGLLAVETTNPIFDLHDEWLVWSFIITFSWFFFLYKMNGIIFISITASFRFFSVLFFGFSVSLISYGVLF